MSRSNYFAYGIQGFQIHGGEILLYKPQNSPPLKGPYYVIYLGEAYWKSDRYESPTDVPCLLICALPTTEPLTWTFYDLPPRTRPRQPGALYQHVGETDSIIWGPLVFKGSRRYVYPLMVKLPRRCLHPPFTPAAFLRTRLDLKSYLMVLSKLPPVVSSFAITGYGQDIPINLRPPEPEVRRNSEDRNRTDLGLAERAHFLVRVGSGSANDIADSNGTIDGGSQESGGPPMTSGFTPINVMAIATTVSQAARGNPELSQFSNLRR